MTEDKDCRVGFIGLGAMGYPMVQNLVKKLSASWKIMIFDIVADALHKIQLEAGEKVVICNSSKEVAEQSVGQASKGLFVLALMIHS